MIRMIVTIIRIFMYKIQVKHLNNTWEDFEMNFDILATAVANAAEYSIDSHIYNMTRVVDQDNDNIIIEFSEGGEKIEAYA